MDYTLGLIKSSEEIFEKILLSKKTGRKKISDEDSSLSDNDNDENDEEEKKNQKNNLKHKLGKSIKKAIHIRELKKIQKLNERFKKSFKNLEHIL